MKGSSLYGKINLNRGGQANRPDGRAKSSAFQKDTDPVTQGGVKETVDVSGGNKKERHSDKYARVKRETDAMEKGDNKGRLANLAKEYGGTWTREDRSGKGGSEGTFVNERGETVQQVAVNQGQAANKNKKEYLAKNTTKKPGAPKLGVFVDGERVTYAAGRKAETEGGNVTYTNKDADNRNKEDLSSTDKTTKMNAEQYVKNTTGDQEYKGEKGEEKDFARAKAADAKAQELLERRTRNKKRKDRKDAGVMDKDGRKGSNAKIASEKAFEEANKEIKTVEGELKDGTKTQSVKGASTTINKGNANKGVYSTKNKSDYKKENKTSKKTKNRDNSETKATYIRDVRD